jgi:uroporphyrin-III C-methyltransferase
MTSEWNSLADGETTLAVYMGKSAAPRIARELLQAGTPGDTPVLIVENASLPSERIFPTRLDLLHLVAPAVAGNGPMVMLIGAALKRVKSIEQTAIGQPALAILATD